MRFKRVSEAFNEVAKARFGTRSGIEHSSIDSITDLYDLVNSFIERGDYEEEIIVVDDNYEEKLEENGGLISVNCFDDLEIKDNLRKLLLGYDDVKRNIKTAVQNAWGDTDGDRITTVKFKRWLMSKLRDRGFDAGLCNEAGDWQRSLLDKKFRLKREAGPCRFFPLHAFLNTGSE